MILLYKKIKGAPTVSLANFERVLYDAFGQIWKINGPRFCWSIAFVLFS